MRGSALTLHQKMRREISNAFFGTLNDLNDSDDKAYTSVKAGHKDWAGRYCMKAVRDATAIDFIVEETVLILDRLGIVSSGLVTIYRLEELIIGMKSYYIAWGTLRDLMAKLISSGFDLELAEQDCSWGLVTRVDKVQRTNIPKIIEKHNGLIKSNVTNRFRNDIAHRGKLTDPDIERLQLAKYSIIDDRFGLLNTTHISEEEFKTRMNELHGEVATVANAKQEELQDHFEKTLSFYSEIGVELGSVAHRLLAHNKI